MGLRLLGKKLKGKPDPAAQAQPAPARPANKPRKIDYQPADPIVLEKDDLKRLMQLERFGVIFNDPDRFRGHPLINEASTQTNIAIDDRFGLVPEGFASLPQTIHDSPGCPEVDLEVDAFLIARTSVTNAQYQKFVDDGGYEQLEHWPEDIWPHIIDYTDLTEHLGPRFWREGRHDRRLADHPVVGICYYEAMAYANWAGYRLPTESEWQMAASWRIRSSANVLRRYPWGDALDKTRCNIWASGLAATTPVQQYDSGAAPNGVLQLIGNVWEWTSSEFEVTDDQGRPVVGDMLMMSIRGGAFDTYFPSQATSCFRTGLACLIRAHNVGFRCALSIEG